MDSQISQATVNNETHDIMMGHDQNQSNNDQEKSILNPTMDMEYYNSNQLPPIDKKKESNKLELPNEFDNDQGSSNLDKGIEIKEKETERFNPRNKMTELFNRIRKEQKVVSALQENVEFAKLDTEDEANRLICGDEENDDECENQKGSENQSGNYDDNMSQYVNNYGISIDIPGFYIQQTKFYPANPEYLVQIIKYAIPQYNGQRIYTHLQNGEIKDQTGDELFNDEIYKSTALRLLLQTDMSIQQVAIVPIPKSKKVTIAFSPDGQYLAILMKMSNVFIIYKINNSDIYCFFQKMQDQTVKPLIEFRKQSQFAQTKQLEFCQNSKYLCVYGFLKLQVIDMGCCESGVIPKIIDQYHLDQQNFKLILDIQIQSLDEDQRLQEIDPAYDQPYKIEVACLSQKHRSIIIYNIKDKEVNMNRTLIFKNEVSKDMAVKISEDFSKVVVGNMSENYMLKQYIDEKGVVQFDQCNIDCLKDKVIRTILNAGTSEFIFICCNEYDQDLDIRTSMDEDFDIGIDRRIEPDSIEVLDCYQDNANDQGFGDKLAICSIRGDELFIDTVNPLAAYAKLKNMEEDKYFEQNTIINSNSEDEIQAFNQYWPYVVIKGMNNNLLVFNANEKESVIRIELPDLLVKIPKTFITQLYELFILGETMHGYILFKVDLDEYNDEINKEDRILTLSTLMEYQKSDVQDAGIVDFHVRSAPKLSQQTIMNRQKKTIALFMHSGFVYFWIDNAEEENIQHMSYTKSILFDQVDDENIYIGRVNESEDEHEWQYMKIVLLDKTLSFEPAFSMNHSVENVSAFGFDQSETVLIILYQQTQSERPDQNFVRIVDLKDNGENVLLYNHVVEDEELIGRLTSMLYCFVDGHIYYNNNVIKIRYDLLLKQDTKCADYGEYEVFDYYENILQLGEDTIQNGLPLAQQVSHRLIYVTKSKKLQANRRVLILPYMHERKVHLQSINKDKNYFQTAMQIPGFLGLPQATLLVNVNLTDYKYYIYNLKGILLNRFNFNDLAQEYGPPIAVSNNGKIYIFKKKDTLQLSIISLTTKGLDFVKQIDIIKCVNEYCPNNLYRYKNLKKGSVIAENFYSIKTATQQNNLGDNLQNMKIYYQVNDNMDVCLRIRPMEQTTGSLQEQIGGGDVIYIQKGTVNMSQEFIDRQSTASNVKFGKLKNSPSLNMSFHNLVRNVSQQQDKIWLDEYMFLTSQYVEFEKGMDGFSMNKKHLYFWNNFQIWYCNIQELDDITQMNKLGLFVDPEETVTEIKQVRTGSKDDKVAVVIRQSKTSDCWVTWDVINDNQIGSFDHKLNPKIFWDQEGNCYATEMDCVYFAEESVRLKCYDLRDIDKMKNFTCNHHQKIEEAFGIHHGHKFDGKGHTWLYSNGNISLSYSYMTFVINKAMQEKDSFDNDDYLFDAEQYNYMINRRNALTNRSLISNPKMLSYVLKKFLETDPILLDQLQYSYTATFTEIQEEQDKADGIASEEEEDDYELLVSKALTKKVTAASVKKSKTMLGTSLVKDLDAPLTITPLHIAFQLQNNKSINMILKYLAKLDYSQFNTFRDLMPSLIDYKGFSDFLTEQTFFTMQMENSQSLRVIDPVNESIVAINHAYSTYVDQAYYKEYFNTGTESNYKSHSVKTVGVETGWIINTPEGYKFLISLNQSANLDLFKIEVIQIIIEYLYQRYKQKVVNNRLPLYCVYLLIFLGNTQFFEYMMEESVHENITEKVDMKKKINGTNRIMCQVMAVMNFVCSVSIGITVYIQTIKIGYSYWKTLWSYLDASYGFFNMIASLMILSDTIYTPNLRIIQAVTAVIIWFKALYYLQLVDEISPLVAIIFKIANDIKIFTIILFIFMFAIANAFYMIGRNQIEFDMIAEDDKNFPLYSDLTGAFRFIYYVCLGAFDQDGFETGEKNSHLLILKILFFMVTFLFCVHMMNMLIAIMGDTFSQNKEVEQQLLLKGKLKFVVDNWWMNALGEDKNRIKFIITALISENDDEGMEGFNNLQYQIDQLKYEQKLAHENIRGELNSISTMGTRLVMSN